MTTSITVDLDDRSYPIHVGAGVLSTLGAACGDLGWRGPVLVVSDSQVAPLYADATLETLRVAGLDPVLVTVPAGESSKCQQQLHVLYDAALAAGLDRQAGVIALGGGVVGDLAGYAAATYMRGIRYVQVPTTLLAMVDSAVGGKTGINLPQGKNLIGAFHQPALVVADTTTLRSLPAREFRAGLAEVIKYGVIAEPELLTWLEAAAADRVQTDDDLLERLVERSCLIKAEVVRQDEREGGLRAVLNFGHTVGHAIEQVAGYGTYLHGEAIAVGMAVAARLSVRVQGLPADEEQRLRQVLHRYALPLRAADLSWPDLMVAMQRDKKRVAGEIGFVLAEGLGSVRYGCAVETNVLEQAWQETQDLPDPEPA
jgi:3-dehydroquinate synthase